jgi:alpha-D-ribose 1-methylphosphonate 5-triphosphate synthase subunit PhnH
MLEIDPIWMPDIQQAHFRIMLNAMARPGNCYPLRKTPVEGPAALAVLSTLLDAEVSLSDPHELLRNGDWPMLQANPVAAEHADYLLCDGGRAPDFTPKLGSLSSPEKSATLILVVKALGQGDTRLRLTGPGIAQACYLSIGGIHRQWLAIREEWVCAFPLGVDMILVDEERITALPRTTLVEVI